MSTGSAAIPLLKAAPEAGAGRRPARRRRLARARAVPGARATSRPPAALERAIAVGRDVADRGLALTAECPVAWPSGAFVRVDRLDEEARRGHRGVGALRRRDRLARAHHPPVRADGARPTTAPTPGSTTRRSRSSCGFYAHACHSRGRHAADRERPAGAADAHGRRLPLAGRRPLARPAAVVRPDRGPAARRSTPRTPRCSRNFAAAYPSLFGLASDDELDLPRYAEELGAAQRRRARLRRRTGCSARGCPTAAASWTWTRWSAGSGSRSRTSWPRSTSPTPRARGDMKAGYRAIERALARAGAGAAASARRLGVDPFDWQAVLGRRDPVPAVLELQERFGGRRVLITGGGGWIGGRAGDAAARLPAGAGHAAGLPRGVADRRPPRARRRRAGGHRARARRHPRRRPAGRRGRAARPDVIFHLAAYKHVDWAETPPGGVRRHQPPGQLERAAGRGGGRRRHGRRGLDRQGGAGGQLLRAHQALHGAADARTRRAAAAATAAPCGSSTCWPARAAPPSCSCARRAPASR